MVARGAWNDVVSSQDRSRLRLYRADQGVIRSDRRARSRDDHRGGPSGLLLRDCPFRDSRTVPHVSCSARIVRCHSIKVTLETRCVCTRCVSVLSPIQLGARECYVGLRVNCTRYQGLCTGCVVAHGATRCDVT